MKLPQTNPFYDLSRGQWLLWLSSLAGVAASYLLSIHLTGSGDLLSTIASLIGVTALIFVAKGYVLGQVLTVVFAIFYGIVSLELRYYGEMITYLGMSAPMAICAVVSWIKNPFPGSKEVRVHRLTKKLGIGLFLACAIVTVLFYFLLAALGNASLLVSTISVSTSFLASALTFLRSPYYALAYAANDLVLIVLWSIAAMKEPAYLPMLICFFLFLLNDLYGFWNWKRMERLQTQISPQEKDSRS